MSKTSYFIQYHNIILQAKCQDRIKGNDIYYENHHIIPRCMNGNDDNLNLVLLTGKEHFLCHYYLTKIFPEITGVHHAFWMMCNQRFTHGRFREYEVEAKIYDEARKKQAKAMSNRMVGVPKSKEARRKIGEKHKGKKLSKEHIEILRDVNTGRKLSKEHIEKIRISHTGKTISQETRDKISRSNKGRKLNEDQKLAISERNKGKSNPNYGKKRSKEWKKKHSKYMRSKNMKASQETRDKMSKTRKGKPRNDNFVKNLCDHFVIYGRYFISFKSATECLGYGINIIRSLLENEPLCYYVIKRERKKLPRKSKESIEKVARSHYKSVYIYGLYFESITKAAKFYSVSNTTIVNWINKKEQLCYKIKV